MTQCVAVLNAGSSSIKLALYQPGETEPLLYDGQLEKIGVAPRLHIADAAGNSVEDRSWPDDRLDHAAGTQVILETAIRLLDGLPVAGVGHRVVHGGTQFAAPALVDDAVLAALAELSPLAPLHQPHNLAPIRTIRQAAPHIPQVACFDTAFHQTQPPLAQTFALPREMTDSGIRRYGFHGLSYEFVSGRLRTLAPDLADKRVIISHLGNGASLCALHGGKSQATTMGFTAVEGLMMGTRCGSLDVGVLIYLMDERGMDARALEDLVYRRSGLLGVSGVSSDMRALRASQDPNAAEAIDLFVYRIVREIGSLAAALGGLDALVFTGGIGEHDAETRRAIATGCAWLGVRLDEEANRRGEGEISAPDVGVATWVIPTDEELVVARHTSTLLGVPW
ncbi:acetate kinase [Sphingomonas sp. DBB INV C78]|uniref:acetate/propionate family kinase n=1 Tax=Sphingomonas sp. DBB INV C78 TaxID=3349434 RepID=UPI0036D2636F